MSEETVISEVPESGTEIEKQRFNRIKKIDAIGGHVVVLTDDSGDYEEERVGKRLLPQVWTWREAAQRARDLNRILHSLPEADKEAGFAIIDEIISKVREAKAQKPRAKLWVIKESNDVMEELRVSD